MLIPPEESVYVQADPDRISQVISNYVTNALKYSDAGRPIRIGLEHTNQYVKVWVQDEGPGLSKEAQKQIWRRFYQLKASATTVDSKQGLGLGLYICQTIIQRHQGRLG
ncbi:sensor histidine kinase [Dictyobacter kobayashii]|uniref:histidine kinase n=1 Tax=Dictyobacter kobayashii TaxID=2014872 RepID=A0A402AW54_9CHLR|nr:sensor histidine kinase [Dictyobacter kobayashii]GCE23362.1 hypothetical protein KDK_71620 [Dictyobacter kobayashii]